MSALTLADAARMMANAVLDRTYEETTLGPHITRFLTWKRMGARSERTLDQYERDLSRMAIVLAHRSPQEVSTPDLMLVLEKFPPGSWRRARAAMNQFWIYMSKNDFVNKNPMDLLPEIRQPPSKIYDLFDSGEQARVAQATDISLLPERDRLGVLIFQTLGVRKTEALNLQVSSFDMVARVAIVRKAKGNKQRAVPFTDELFIALTEFLNTPIPRVRTRENDRWVYDDREPIHSDYIFFPNGASAVSLLWTDPSKPMAQGSMHRWWERQARQAGVRYRSLHINRHTVGTGLIDAGVDPFLVKDWLGHEKLDTTDVYVHNSRERLKSAAEKFRQARVRNETKQSPDAFSVEKALILMNEGHVEELEDYLQGSSE